MSEQIPTIGRIVQYRLSASDTKQINRRRTTGSSIAGRMTQRVGVLQADGETAKVYGWPAGAQAHIGNEAREGDVFPMLITKTWGTTAESAVNGQVFLDGNDVYWATSCIVGDGPGQFAWPTRA